MPWLPGLIFWVSSERANKWHCKVLRKSSSQWMCFSDSKGKKTLGWGFSVLRYGVLEKKVYPGICMSNEACLCCDAHTLHPMCLISGVSMRLGGQTILNDLQGWLVTKKYISPCHYTERNKCHQRVSFGSYSRLQSHLFGIESLQPQPLTVQLEGERGLSFCATEAGNLPYKLSVKKSESPCAQSG